jgi:hypothetical protein
VVLGIAVPNIFNMTLYGERLNFTTNFISPQGAGVTINNQQYLLALNGSEVINQTRTYNYTLSVELVNVSLQPILHTIALIVRSRPNPINVTAQNATINIPSNRTLSVRNLTSSNLIPILPSGYRKELVQNITVRQRPDPPSKTNTTIINAAIKYNCSIPSYDEVPLILSNYSWAQISSFSVKPDDCVVTFSFGQDPILAMSRHVAVNKTTTTIPFTTTIRQASTTSIPSSPQPIGFNKLGQYLAIAIILMFILAMAAIAAYERHKGRKVKARAEKEVKARNNQGPVSKPVDRKAIKKGGVKAPESAILIPGLGATRCANCNHAVARLPSGEVVHGTLENPTVLCLAEDCDCSAPRVLKGSFVPKPKAPGEETKLKSEGTGGRKMSTGKKKPAERQKKPAASKSWARTKKAKHEKATAKPGKRKARQEPNPKGSAPGIPEQPADGEDLGNF